MRVKKSKVADTIDDYELLPEGLEIIRKGKVVMQRFRPGANVEAFREGYIKAGISAAEELGVTAQELIASLNSVSPVYLIAGVMVFCVIGPEQGSDASYFATRDSLIEYLCGLAASISAPKEDRVPPDLAYATFNKLRSIVPLLERVYQGKKFAEASRADIIDDVRFSLGLEDLFDRMEGYVPHLEILVKRTFEPIRSECMKHLGFSPTDIPAIVRAIVERRREALQGVVPEGKSLLAEARSEGFLLTKHERTSVMLTLMYGRFSEEFAFEPVDDLALRSGIPKLQVQLILSAMSCPWGVQPDFLLPYQENRFRLYPVFQLAQRFSVPLPWSLLHQCFRWFESYAKEKAPELLVSWYKSRDKASESIVRETIEKIFGPEIAFGPVKYLLNGEECEADGAIILPPWGIAVEVKAHSLTPSGRKGVPGRLRRKTEELIEVPVSQAERFSRFLEGAGAEVTLPGRRHIKLPAIRETSILVATFERIDPLSHFAFELLGDSGTQKRLWAVCLADLMMVAEILRRPCEFWFYSCIRAELSSTASLITTMEADILAGFLRDRLSEFISQGRQLGGRLFLDYCADSVNKFFTNRELGIKAEVPSVGIPALVLDELDRLMKSQASHWPELVERAMRQPREEWHRLNNVIKKVRRTKVPRILSFRDPALELIVYPDASHSLQQEVIETPRLILTLE